MHASAHMQTKLIPYVEAKIDTQDDRMNISNQEHKNYAPKDGRKS